MTNTYFCLKTRSHFSLLHGLSKPKDIAARLEELALPGAALVDLGSLSGTVNYFKTMTEKKLKPILGCEVYFSYQDSTIKTKENRELFSLVFLAKNLDGWKSLIKIVSESNSPDRFYYRPRLDLAWLVNNCVIEKNLIVIYCGGNSQCDRKIIAHVSSTNAFGHGNCYIGLNFTDNPDERDGKRVLANQTGLQTVALPNAFYCRKEDAEDQHILLCTHLKTTLAKVKKSLETDDENAAFRDFFASSDYYIPSYNEMKEKFSEEELEDTIRIANLCEEFDILHTPILPIFPCPNNEKPDEYFRQLCRKGWKEKIAEKVDKSLHPVYIERVKEELEIFQKVGLSGYFLILWDILRYVSEMGGMPGPGRGSSCGCLTAYLMGITGIDSIKYGLLLSRFYNSARSHSMPDIDVDIPVNYRDKAIQYIKDKYGEDRVGQMVTFQTMKGRGAIKDVLRAHGNISFDEMNRITEHIPDEAKIADELQEMKEGTGESSIIQWALENRATKLKDWCYIDEKGVLQGPLSKRFEQAIRLEGTKTAQSKHASGIVIGNSPLGEICPMIYDSKNKQKICGLEMNDLEKIGLVKFDILGLSTLDRIIGIADILETGDIKLNE